MAMREESTISVSTGEFTVRIKSFEFSCPDVRRELEHHAGDEQRNNSENSVIIDGTNDHFISIPARKQKQPVSFQAL